VSYRQEFVLPADRIRALPKGTALLLATGVRPALIRLRPWYKEPNAAAVSAEAKREFEAITNRAAMKWDARKSGGRGPSTARKGTDPGAGGNDATGIT